MELADLQARIEATFGARDRARGVDGTFRWWVEEVGEVAKALRQRDPAALEHELGDALAWLVSVANVAGVDLERAAARYADGCPRCHHTPCVCPLACPPSTDRAAPLPPPARVGQVCGSRGLEHLTLRQGLPYHGRDPQDCQSG